jgi:hypothetical protein
MRCNKVKFRNNQLRNAFKLSNSFYLVILIAQKRFDVNKNPNTNSSQFAFLYLKNDQRKRLDHTKASPKVVCHKRTFENKKGGYNHFALKIYEVF